MVKILTVLGGLLFIGMGVRAILTRRASFDWHIGNGELRLDEPPTQVRGWPAVVVGVLSIGTGVGIIAKYAL
ncbi:hypothetical protein FE772_00225 [Lysobacter enzymogenes]|nr:hypothetical protein FE772_00225 [Lysobacter enzymogenes]